MIKYEAEVHGIMKIIIIKMVNTHSCIKSLLVLDESVLIVSSLCPVDTLVYADLTLGNTDPAEKSITSEFGLKMLFDIIVIESTLSHFFEKYLMPVDLFSSFFLFCALTNAGSTCG